MKNKIFTTILITTVLLGLHKMSTFAFGVPKMNLPVSLPASPLPKSNVDTSAYKGQIATINTSMDQANAYMNASIFALSGILLNKDTLQKLKTEKDEILTKTKDKEKQASMNKVATDYMATLQEGITQNTINSQVSQLNLTQKQLFSDAVYNLGLAGLNYADIALQITQLTKSISANPTVAMSLGLEMKQLGKLATSLPQQAKTATVLAGNLVKIGVANKIAVKLPASKTDKPKKVDFNIQ
ncbi:MAG: hypothetical protein PHC34_02540 [Candidatus Gastranaerophilales bacterium]|nr:hypothetical protein [Candidatus Gastranaerophilales bacterium]